MKRREGKERERRREEAGRILRPIMLQNLGIEATESVSQAFGSVVNSFTDPKKIYLDTKHTSLRSRIRDVADFVLMATIWKPSMILQIYLWLSFRSIFCTT